MNPPNPESLHFIFLHGKVGSGKDTQASELLNTSPYATIINTGDIFRSARDPENRYHDQLSPFTHAVEEEGQLIPDDVMVDIVRQEIDKRAGEGNKVFIFTGFPRTEPQLMATDSMLAHLQTAHEVHVDHVFLLVLDTLSRKRAETRREEAIERGLAPRKDDDPEIVVQRLRVYHDLTNPMLRKLSREHRLYFMRGNKSIKEVKEGLQMMFEGQTPTGTERK